MKTTEIKNWLKSRPAIALLAVIAAVAIYLATGGDIDLVDDALESTTEEVEGTEEVEEATEPEEAADGDVEPPASEVGVEEGTGEGSP